MNKAFKASTPTSLHYSRRMIALGVDLKSVSDIFGGYNPPVNGFVFAKEQPTTAACVGDNGSIGGIVGKAQSVQIGDQAGPAGAR